MSATELFAAVALAIFCWLLSHAVRHYALRAKVLDIPTARSSHTLPTPRGGGLAIVICSGLAAAGQYYFAPGLSAVDKQWLQALFLPAVLLGLFSFIDDHQPLSRRLRLAVHLASAGFMLYLLPATVYLPLGTVQLPINSIWLLPISALGIAWLINLYNFMDGIDGIAATQAISVLLSLLGIAFLTTGHLDRQLLWTSAIIAGFTAINWAPAKLFMGDIGSCYLGLLIAAFIGYCSSQYALSPWVGLILMAAFICDASWTLAHRIRSGQAWNEPHRSHSYQILSRRWRSHSSVVCAMLAMNTLWLLPLALLAAYYPARGAFIFVLACLPLLAIGHSLKAGHSKEL